MRTAAVELATGRGVRAITYRAIARRARLTPEQALEHYASVDDCLTGAYDEGCERMFAVCTSALSAQGSWQQRLVAACEATIAEFAARPRLARFCMIEAWQISLPRLAGRRLAVRERSVTMLVECRRADESEAELPELRFELFAGATHHAIREELQDPACDAGSIRNRFDQVIGMFEPATASTAA
jgi:AcrR family transcriptional regulator